MNFSILLTVIPAEIFSGCCALKSFFIVFSSVTNSLKIKLRPLEKINLVRNKSVYMKGVIKDSKKEINAKIRTLKRELKNLTIL